MTAHNNTANPDAPLRLLSLDGGGVRGLSSLMVLEDLMESIALEEKRLRKRHVDDNTPLKPCDYFDLIGGTSTGGIIAILLGRLRLDCRQCIKVYTEVSRKIFRRDRSFRIGNINIPLGATRFSGAVLETSIKEALVQLGYHSDELLWDDTLFEEDPINKLHEDNIWTELTDQPLSDSPETSRYTIMTKSMRSWGSSRSSTPGQTLNQGSRRATWRKFRNSSVHRKTDQKGCRTFVVATLKNALGLPRILSTFDPNDRETRIWEALRATTAAPTFFEEMTFGTPRVTYLDGGMGFNNPCAEVDYAAKSIWEGRRIGLIVSIGTGLQTIPSVKKIASWLPFGLGTDISLAAALVSMSTCTARVDNEMQRMYFGSATQYHRFDVDGGLANVSLEQWMREDEMAALTEQYMRDAEQIQQARRLAETMVTLSGLPPAFEIDASRFRAGMAGRAFLDGSFAREDIDLLTGELLKLRPTADADAPAVGAAGVPTAAARRVGLAMNHRGSIHEVFPVPADLDGDGRRNEAVIATCVRAEDVCLRALRTGVPQGRYRVKFIVSLFGPAADDDDADGGNDGNDGDEGDEGDAGEFVPPTELVFSAGTPHNAATFLHRYIDVRISPDAVPVLLGPDAVRVRVGRERFEEVRGKGWVEIQGDVEVQVGLDGTLGFVVSKRFEEGKFVGGWSFGGVKLDPVVIGE